MALDMKQAALCGVLALAIFWALSRRNESLSTTRRYAGRIGPGPGPVFRPQNRFFGKETYLRRKKDIADAKTLYSAFDFGAN